MMSAGFAFPQMKQNGEFFNGQLGIFPFVQQVPAKRKSKNRASGTLETKSQNVTAEVYYDWQMKNA